MNISREILMATSNAYIVDNILIKYRGNAYPIHEIGKILSEQELEEMKTLENVVIETKDVIQFFNFTGKSIIYRG